MNFIAALFILASVLAVQGTPVENIPQRWLRHKKECMEETGISNELVDKLINDRIFPQDDRVPKFMVCNEKKEQTLTNEGALNEVVIKEIFIKMLGEEDGVKAASKCIAGNHGKDEKAIVYYMYKCYFDVVSKEQEAAFVNSFN